MKRILCMMMSACLFLSLVGCSNSSDKKEETPRKEETKEETNPTQVSEPKTIRGKITEATSTHFSIVTSSGVSYYFDRSDMILEGGSIMNDEEIEVVYVIKDGKKIAQKGTIIVQQEAVVDTRQSIDDIISHMSIEEKVGQLFFVRCPDSNAANDVENYHLGGYILFDRDFNGLSYRQVVNNIASYQKKAKIPLLVGVDEEGGTVVRLSRYPAFRAVPFWSPQDLYKQGGFDLIRSDTKEKATLLKNIGINVNLAPVADVSTNPNDFINARSFGKDANQTAEFVKTIVGEMKQNNIGVTLKHFPGYGNNVDTHTGISIDKRSYDSFVNNDFLPFEAGIAAGADSILVSHNIITSVDGDKPASLSSKIHDILRNELGFHGVIMTDDLAMDAIKEYSDSSAAAISAITAGNDLLVCTDYRIQIPAVLEAINEGKIDANQLNASVKRILTWKANMGLINVK